MLTHVKLFFCTQTFANQFLEREKKKAIMQLETGKVGNDDKNRQTRIGDKNMFRILHSQLDW